MANKIWSTYQLAIFAWAVALDGVRNLIIQAFAGTGKTTTMVELVNRAPEPVILMCAFAKKNQLDLQAKVTRAGVDTRTFNSLGYERCRKYMGNNVRMDGDRAARLAQFVCGVAAPRDMVKLVAKLSAKGKHTLPGWETRERIEARVAADKAMPQFVREQLRREWTDAPQVEMEDLAREHDLTPDEQWEEEGWNTARIAKLALAAMKLAATAHTLSRQHPHYDCSVDGDDQCYLPIANSWVNPRYDMVVVDECQDTSLVQLKLARGLLRQGGRFVVVGDRFQALYRFRGAAADSMDKLKAEMSTEGKGGIVEMTLPETYRCGRAIVAEAARLVPGYVAHASNAEGSVTHCTDRELVKQAQPGDFILSRANAPLVATCLSFLRAGKRCKVEGKDIGTTLVTLVGKLNAKSLTDFLLKLNRWEERECERATKTAKTDEQAEAKCDQIHDKADTLRAIAEGLSGMTELTARITDLFADNAANGEQVVCMTVHKAKGLETDRVFLLEHTFKAKDGVKASGKAKKADKSQDEIFIRYVAITRAKKELVYVDSVSATHEANVTAAAAVTGDTLEAVAAAIKNVKQLMEKDANPQLADALAQLEAKHSQLTQAKA